MLWYIIYLNVLLYPWDIAPWNQLHSSYQWCFRVGFWYTHFTCVVWSIRCQLLLWNHNTFLSAAVTGWLINMLNLYFLDSYYMFNWSILLCTIHILFLFCCLFVIYINRTCIKMLKIFKNYYRFFIYIFFK